jgi:hypothetical protein
MHVLGVVCRAKDF